MATQNNVNINVTVDDNGTTEKLDQKAQKTHKTMKDMVKTAASIVVPSMPAGASRVATASQPTGSSRLMSEVEYNAARGTAGVTGASARDFAKQAEGLSGLVRLYAVYAANIYAAGAAFTALSKAMDTTNMVKGLDQLGAASGMALGTLAKDFAAATEGAISLRDSMEAVAKASSSGMSSAQILRMAKAADQASKALGINMQDAVSRITRGITKLEPELLDELGIFIRIDDVTKEYAKSVNKAASELTDFERRQAVANAVLDQAERKFSALDIDTNPYTKLAATLQNLAQSGLELVNKVLAPVVGYLSQSPVALSLAMAGLVGIIVKQALPAIGQFGESITESSRIAVREATARLNIVKGAIEKDTAAQKAAADANAELASSSFEKVQIAMEEKYASSTKRAKKFAKEMQAIIALPVSEIVRSPEMMATAQKYAEKGDGKKGISKDYNELYKSLMWYKAEEEDYIKTSEELNKQKLDKLQEAEAKYYSEKSANLQKIAASELRASVSTITSTQSMSAAFKELSVQISNSRKGLATVNVDLDEIDAAGQRTTKTISQMVPKVSLLGAATMAAGAAFSIVATKVGQAMSKSLIWLEVIGAVVVALGIFDSFMSKATKQVDEFNGAIDKSKQVTENLAETVEALYEKTGSGFFSVDSMKAQSTALIEAADSFAKVGKNAEKAQKAIADGSWWDRLKDGVYSLFGGGIQKNFEANLSTSIKGALAAIESGPLKQEATSKVLGILGIDDIKDLDKALVGLKPGSKIVEELAKFFNKSAVEAANAASKSETFGEKLKEYEQVVKNFLDQFKQKDPLTLVASGSISNLIELDKLLGQDIPKSISAVKGLLQKEDLFGQMFLDTSQVGTYVEELSKIEEQLKAQNDAVQELKAEEARLEAQRKEFEKARASGRTAEGAAAQNAADRAVAAFDPVAQRKQIEEIQGKLRAAETSQANTRAEAAKIFAKIQSTIPQALSRQIGLIEQGIISAMEKGTTSFKQNVLAAAGAFLGDPALIRLETQLKIKELNLAEQEVTAAGKLIQELKINSAEQSLNTAQLKLLALKGTQGPEIAAAQKQYEAAQLTLADTRSNTQNVPQIPGSPIDMLQATGTWREDIAAARVQSLATTISQGTAAMAAQVAAADAEVKKAQQKLTLLQQIKVDPKAVLSALKDVDSPLKLTKEEKDEFLKFAQDSAGIIGKARVKAAQVQQIQTEGQIGEVKVVQTRQENEINLQQKLLKVQQDLLAEKLAAGAIDRENYLTQAETLELQNTDLNYNKALVAARAEYALNMITANNLQATANTDLEREAATRAEILAKTIYAKQVTAAYEADATAGSAALRKTETERLAITQRDLEINQDITKLTKDAADIRRDTDLERLNNLYKTAEVSGTLGPAEAKNAQLVLDIERNRQETSQKLADLNFNYTQKREKDLLALKAVTDEQEKARRAELMKAEDALYIAQTSNISAVGKLRQDELQQQISGIASLTDALTNLADSLKGITDSLDENVIGNFAKGLSDTLTSFTSLLTKNEENTKAIEKFGQTASDAFDLAREAPDMESYNKYIAEGNKALELKAKAEEKAQKDELKGYTQTANAAKKMFKEKTAAYKVFNAIEKTSQAMSLALELKTAAVKIATWMGLVPAKVTAEAGVTAAEAGGAAARAPVTYGEIIGNYLSKIPAPFGMVAGVAAGAFFLSLLGKGGGSKSAFVPTAEQRQETQGTAMGWDINGNQIQTSRGVLGDTGAKSESIAKSLEVIEATSVEGLDYNNQMLQALRQIRDNIGKAAISLYGIKGLTTGSLNNTIEGTNTSGGLLGIGGLFSKSTTKSIIDSGIKLAGTFGELIKGVTGTIQTFETVSTTVKKSGFLGIGSSTKTRVSTQYQDLLGLDTKAFKALQTTFDNAADLILSIADSAGYAAEAVSRQLMAIPVDEMISLRGLKGEDFTKELSSVIGKVLDDASLAIFGEFEQFAKFGEGMLETVVRVVDTNKKVTQSLENSGIDLAATIAKSGATIQRSFLGFSFGATTSFAEKDLKQLSYKVTESLVNLAGGLQEFLDASTFYQEHFLTDAERLVPTTKAVSKELARLAALGYTSADGLVDTRDEFKKLVNSLDLTTTSGQEAYTALMKLAPGFDTIMQSAEDTASTFRDFAKQISDFRTGLLLGSQSTLTPLEKLAKAQSEFESTAAKAMSGDKDAMSKLTSTASTYLDMASVAFASSESYSKVFSAVNTTLSQAEAYASTTADTAELQLSQLQDQTLLLQNIDTGIAKLAGITPTVIQTAATGGWRSGVTLVGEEGPELVDFQTPGRVYTADQTAGMFTPVGAGHNQQALVTELQALRKEVAQLRKEQQQQTGDIIISNYDANTKSATTISTAVVSTAQDAAWATRSAPSIS